MSARAHEPGVARLRGGVLGPGRCVVAKVRRALRWVWWRRARARRGAASRGRLLAAPLLRRRRADYPAVTFLRSSCPVTWMVRGLACSCTGMDRVSTPAW